MSNVLFLLNITELFSHQCYSLNSVVRGKRGTKKGQTSQTCQQSILVHCFLECTLTLLFKQAL